MTLLHESKEHLATEPHRGKEENKTPLLHGEEDKTDCGASPTSAGENQQKTTTTPNSCRPFTRSQTGYVPKRRRRDDSPPVVAPRRVASPPRKKRQRSVKTPSDELHADTPRESKSSDPPSRRSGSEVSTMHDHKSISPGNSAQLSFPPGSSSSTTSSIGDTNSDWRGSRPRGTLPIPIPNLTKKSRGRRVPTKLGGGNSTINDTDQTDTRMYVCKVESCRKCFHRGEHLKRHIRSIHTHEKPFACLHANCEKRFNRHDNLLQHLKVHKDLAPPSPTPLEDARSPSQSRRSLTPTPPPEQRSSPAQETYEISITQARRAAAFRRRPSYMDYDHPFASSSEPTRLVTNMAVSSLRTEIPHSP